MTADFAAECHNPHSVRASYTRETGEDTHDFLDQLFKVLDTEVVRRAGLPEHLRDFGYVNGNLFERRCPSPRFSAKARAVILECGTLDWSQINPDIFGSMIQAVVHPVPRPRFTGHLGEQSDHAMAGWASAARCARASVGVR